jgi:hypothetical protein
MSAPRKVRPMRDVIAERNATRAVNDRRRIAPIMAEPVAIPRGAALAAITALIATDRHHHAEAIMAALVGGEG